MKQLLFLSSSHSVRGPMAMAFARARANADLRVLGAAVDEDAGKVHPLAVRAMEEAGLSPAGQEPLPLSMLPWPEIDAAVALDRAVAETCPLHLPGQPPQVRWEIPAPLSTTGSPEPDLDAIRACRDRIRCKVDELFEGNYLDTLIQSKHKVHLILDSLSEGIMIHDLNRKVVFFNRVAEEITGYTRAEVVGRDCHRVFSERFCSGNCSFSAKPVPNFDCKTFLKRFHNRSGEERELEMSVRSVLDDYRAVAGVLISFRDLTRENTLARRLGEIKQFRGIIGHDSQMRNVFELIRSVADSNVPVLIQGESGTGKELVASAIHNEGARASEHFVPVNCGALPEGLLESELFGHVRGAFTGAIHDKKGRFEVAHGGTLFLDEIGDISPAMQVKLLRVLQEGAFERVGSSKTIHVDVRVISATHKDLRAEIEAGRFREDLYYRLCVLPIHLPPLRERPGDIPLLVDHFLERIGKESNRPGLTIAPGAMDVLLSFEWSGNVRELQNALQYALVKCRDSVIEVNHLPPNIVRGSLEPLSAPQGNPAKTTPGRKKKLDTQSVIEALRSTGGRKRDAARLLNVGRATLYRFLKENKSILEALE